MGVSSWGAGFRLNMETERPDIKDRAKDKGRESKGSQYSHNIVGPCMSSDHIDKNKVLGTLGTEVKGSDEVHKDFPLRKKRC